MQELDFDGGILPAASLQDLVSRAKREELLHEDTGLPKKALAEVRAAASSEDPGRRLKTADKYALGYLVPMEDLYGPVDVGGARLLGRKSHWESLILDRIREIGDQRCLEILGRIFEIELEAQHLFALRLEKLLQHESFIDPIQVAREIQAVARAYEEEKLPPQAISTVQTKMTIELTRALQLLCENNAAEFLSYRMGLINKQAALAIGEAGLLKEIKKLHRAIEAAIPAFAKEKQYLTEWREQKLPEKNIAVFIHLNRMHYWNDCPLKRVYQFLEAVQVLTKTPQPYHASGEDDEIRILAPRGSSYYPFPPRVLDREEIGPEFDAIAAQYPQAPVIWRRAEAAMDERYALLGWR